MALRSKQRSLIIGFALCNIALASARAQGVDVSAQVRLQDKAAAAKHKDAPSPADVVVWLTPLEPNGHPASIGHPGPFRLVQKDKQFTPHLLVVPTGSNVEFPNHDPFFHNVFSLFNGKRFDLGLYESGSSRAVRFDREGVSYIFCNIHPEMGAVVLALSTPYYAVSGDDGVITIHRVPLGSYRMNVWSENAEWLQSAETQRIVQIGIGAGTVRLGEIAMLPVGSQLGNHKNKFGEDYRPEPHPPY